MSAVFIDDFSDGWFTIQSESGKQGVDFEDSDRFGPSKLDTRTGDVSPVPDRHWFWRFYQPWREAGRPTQGERTSRYGVIKIAVWPTAFLARNGKGEGQ